MGGSEGMGQNSRIGGTTDNLPERFFSIESILERKKGGNFTNR